MKNTFGTGISVTLFGESHGAEIGAVIDGLSPGIKVDYDLIESSLTARRPYGKLSTARCESDPYRIVSGVYNGYTTGTPIAIIIPNGDTRSRDYSYLKDTPRPSHADYAAEVKYHGYQDERGGGHFSGRLTAPLVIVGAILRSALMNKGIYIGTHISRLHGVTDREILGVEDVKALSNMLFPVLDASASENMQNEILKARESGDSVGGILETAVYGVPAGVGEPFFDSVESLLSHALFSIPGIKGVEFGAGFRLADMLGSEANDPFTFEGERVVTRTNNSGGINGGITNGMPITVRCAVRPTPSIFKEQATVSLKEAKDTTLSINGRHDPAIVHRARAAVDAVTAIVIADLLTTRHGTDYLK